MNTRSSGKYLPWLLQQSVVEAITGSKPPIVKMAYLQFRYHHLQLQEAKKGSATVREAVKLAVKSVCEW